MRANYLDEMAGIEVHLDAMQHLDRIAFLCVVSLAGLAAQDYHVSASGNNTGPGTLSQPWQTITRVNQAALNPGDRVLFAGSQIFTGNWSSPARMLAPPPVPW